MFSKQILAMLITAACFIVCAQAGAATVGVKRYVPAAQQDTPSQTVETKTGQCGPSPRPVFFYVLMDEFQEKYLEGKGFDDLATLKKSKTEAEGVFHEYVLGITQTSIGAKPMFQAYTEAKSDHLCIYLSQVEISVSAKPKIYIASEITDQECRQHVFDHEKSHVRIYREDFMGRGPDLRKHLMDKYIKQNGWYIASGPNIDARIKEKYEEIRKEIFDDVVSTLNEYIESLAPRHASEVDNAPGEKEKGAECLSKIPSLKKRINAEAHP